ncbi:hypothetical protein STENM36S_04395 [Streptomyces tendae]
MSAARIAAASLAPSPTMPDDPSGVPQGLDDQELLLGRHPGHHVRVAQHPGAGGAVGGGESSPVPRPRPRAGPAPGPRRWRGRSADGRRSAPRAVRPPRAARAPAPGGSRATSASASSPVNSSSEGCCSRTSDASSPSARVRPRHRDDAQSVAGEALCHLGGVCGQAGAGGQHRLGGALDHQYGGACPVLASDGGGVAPGGLEGQALLLRPPGVVPGHVKDRLVGGVGGPGAVAVQPGAGPRGYPVRCRRSPGRPPGGPCRRCPRPATAAACSR